MMIYRSFFCSVLQEREAKTMFCAPKLRCEQVRCCGKCALAFAAGMITALVLSSGAATVLIAISFGCFGVLLVAK